MKYPCLILKSMCKTEIHLEIEQEGRNVYGEPLEPIIWDGLCNYQDSGKTVLTAAKVLMQLSRQWKDGAHSRTEAYTA